MDRLRRLGKSKSSSKNIEGYQHVHKEKNKSKLASSSLVARLMGFDGLKSQHTIHRQHQSFVDHNLLRTSPRSLQGDAQLPDGQSHRKRSTEQPEFKDVYEYKVRKSVSNKDVILELLQQPSPLFAKHLHGVQESSSSSLCNHLPVLKQSNPEIYEAKDRKVERNTFMKHDTGSRQTHEDGILNRSCTLTSTHNSPKPSKIGGEGKEGTNKGTTRIVILKPNYAMARDARNSLSSLDPLRANMSGSRKSKGHMNDWTKDEDFVKTIEFSHGVEVSASRVREARKIAKKFTREISETACTMKDTEAREAAKRFNREVREVFSRMRIDFPSCVKEIPGTGGLHDFSGIDSASESEVMKMTSYDSTESFVSRQAKKRLLERWKRAQRYEHVGEGGKGGTLGEMLCIPDGKLRNLDAANSRWDSPLGNDSGDGWKEKYSKIRSRSRSRSLPPPGTRSEQLNAEREYRIDDKLLMSKEVRYRGQSDGLPGNFTGKEDFSSKNSRPSKRKSSRVHRHASNSYTLLENHLTHDEIDLVKKDSPEEQPMVPPTPTVTSTIDTGESTTLEFITDSPVSSDVLPPYISRSMPKRCDSSSGGQENSNPKHSGAGAESSGSSKEADHTSPISDLEVPSRVSSGPEYFEQVSADLCAFMLLLELRKQIYLLRKESETNVDAPMQIKTDFAGEGLSLAVDEKEKVVSECWESSYIVDVLIESGLYDTDTEMFMSRWQSANDPLGPWVFDNLEKKYCDEIAGPKYERKILFDRIHSVLLEISESCKNLCPWVKPMTAGYGLKWQKYELGNKLHKLLATDVEANAEISEKLFDKVTQWGGARDSVDMIGMKIEKFLINDLITELVEEFKIL